MMVGDTPYLVYTIISSSKDYPIYNLKRYCWRMSRPYPTATSSKTCPRLIAICCPTCCNHRQGASESSRRACPQQLRQVWTPKDWKFDERKHRSYAPHTSIATIAIIPHYQLPRDTVAYVCMFVSGIATPKSTHGQSWQLRRPGVFWGSLRARDHSCRESRVKK